MGILDRQLLCFGLCFTATLVACWVVYTQLRARRRLSRLPSEELRRRPAGESLRLKLMALDDRIGEYSAGVTEKAPKAKLRGP